MPLDSKKLDDANKKISELEEKIKDINKEATESNFTFIDMAKNISDVAKGAKDLSGAIKNSSKLAGSLSDEAKKLAGFTKDDLEDKKKMVGFQKAASKLLSKRAEIESQISVLNIRKASATLDEKTALESTIKILQDGLKESEGLVDNFDKIANTNTKLNKETKYWDKLGATLKTIPGVGPLIAGPFEDASKAMRKARLNNEGFFKSALKGVAELGAAFGPAYLLGTIIKGNDEVVKLGRELQMTTDESLALKKNFDSIALSSGKAYLNQANLKEAMQGLAKETGITAGFSNDQLENQTFLTKQVGLTSKQASKFAKYQTTTGKTAKETNLEIAEQVQKLENETGIVFKLNDIMGEVADTNAGLKAAYGFNNTLLAEQVIKTKQLGINMAQAEKIAGGMLDFESSIEAELKAELLTGKDISLEKARQLALDGKSSEAAAEILKQVGSSHDLAKMNVIQQEALAKAAGMERNELIASVKEREFINKIGGQSIKQQMEGAKTEAERAKIKEKIKAAGGEDLLNQYEATSAAEKFEAVMVKVQGVISSIVQFFSPLIDGLAAMADSTAGLYTILVSIAAIMGTSMYLKFGAMIAQMRMANLLSKERLITDEADEVVKKRNWITEKAINVAKFIGNQFTKEGLVYQGAMYVKQLAINALEGIRNGLKSIALGISISQGAAEATIAASKTAQNASMGGLIAKGLIYLGTLVAQAAAAIATASALTLGIGTLVILAATAAAVAYLYSITKPKKAGDISSAADGKTQVSTKEGGLFELSSNDDLVAAPGAVDKMNQKGGGGGGTQNNAALVARIDQLIATTQQVVNINQQILAKSPVIEMGGNEVSQGINKAEREIQ